MGGGAECPPLFQRQISQKTLKCWKFQKGSPTEPRTTEPRKIEPRKTQTRMDWTSNGLNPEWTQPQMGLNPEWTEPRMGLNPEWTQPWMGLNPDWTQPRPGLNPERTQPRPGLNPEWTELRMGLNLEFLSTSNMVYNVYIYQKNGFKKREHWSVCFSQKKVIRAPTYTSSAPCWRSWIL